MDGDTAEQHKTCVGGLIYKPKAEVLCVMMAHTYVNFYYRISGRCANHIREMYEKLDFHLI